MQKKYCPDRGDLVWLQFTPQRGREQSGKRPALVLSPKVYNYKTQLAVVCPVTTKVKGYPFEVELPAGLAISGAVLSDHVKNIDWLHRRAEFVDKVSVSVIASVVERIHALINIY